MHGDQKAWFDAENEIVGSGIKHGSLPGIYGEKRDIDAFPAQRPESFPKILIRFLNFTDAGFVPPMPEIQVSGMEKMGSEYPEKEGNAQICGIKSRDGDVILQLQCIPGSHPFPAGPDRHVGGNDVGHVSVIFPGINDRIKVIHMFMTDKNKNFPKSRQFLGSDPFFGRQLFLFSEPVVKNEEQIPAGNGESAVIIVNDFKLLTHGYAHLRCPNGSG
jgi:hypothetical protein